MNWLDRALQVSIALFVAVALIPMASSNDTVAAGPRIEIETKDSLGATPGPEAHFTGTVRIESSFQRKVPARAGGALVTFEPGARTAWHTHPLGQTLIVTSGAGWVQQWDGEKQSIRAGDVIWIPPGTKHWHGATAHERLSHLAIQEASQGKVVDWMEKVSDEQYAGRSPVSERR